MRLDYNDWILECDVNATRQAYRQIVAGGADSCTCSYCRNYCLVRRDIFPKEAQRLLENLGIDWHREAEVYHMGRQASGLHFYGGWLSFVGNILCHSDEIQLGNNFTMSFKEPSAPTFSQFQTQRSVEVNFTAYLPWVLPEEDEPN